MRGRDNARVRWLATLLVTSAISSIALAQPAPAPAASAPSAKPPSPEPADDEVVVTGHRPVDSVVGDIKPEITLNPADIQSYGVSTVTELMEELAPETRSDRGRGGESPVILLNGHRISGFNEVQSIPTEAILRIDILPEEVSLKYGYTANQRVVNIVLRRRFRAVTAEAGGDAPTEGGQVGGQAEIDQFRIRRDTRLNMDLKYQGATNLTEADRNIVEAPATGTGATETGADRTLSPATQSLTGNAVFTHPIFAGINATVNGTLAVSRSNALQGLPEIALNVPAADPFAQPALGPRAEQAIDPSGPLRQEVEGWTAHLGTTLNRDRGEWRLSLTGAYDHADSETITDTGFSATPFQTLLNALSPSFNPYVPLPPALLQPTAASTARSITDGANTQILANGPVLSLPAGSLYVSFKTGDTQSWLSSTSTRLGVFQATNLARNDFNAQLNLDAPLTSREHDVLGVIGTISVNGNAAVDQLSDFGPLVTLGYGANWTPVTGVNLVVSHTTDRVAPTVAQLAGPLISTPGVPVFDFVTGQTVAVTTVSGGNAALVSDRRDVLKIGLTLKPYPSRDLTVTANYIDSHIHNPILSFPSSDPALQTAFPTRFERDAEGTLISEDERPVNFAQQNRRELRYGVNFSRPLGKQPPPRTFRPRPTRPAGGGGDNGGDRADGDRGGGGSGGGGGRGGGFGPGRSPPGAGGRLQLAVYHTLLFDDNYVVRPGGPVLDLLNGAAAGSNGGAPRNEIEAQAGFTLAGVGARLSADWKSATRVVGVPGSPTGDLAFSDIGTVNLRVFDNLGQQRSVLKRAPWLRGSRITLSVTNLFDERIQVRDATGVTPLIYQSAYLDPAGRTIKVSFRKLFF